MLQCPPLNISCVIKNDINDKLYEMVGHAFGDINLDNLYDDSTVGSLIIEKIRMK